MTGRAPNEIEVRPVEPGDAEALIRFFLANDVPDVTRHFHPFPLDRANAERIACQPGKDRYYLAWQDHRPVGFAMLRGWNEGYEIPSFGLLVDRRCQGRGIGRQLTERVLEYAAKLATAVRLTVDEDNVKALAIYQSLGFEMVASKAEHHARNSYVMRKEFC